MSLNDNPDSVYYSDDKNSYATIKRQRIGIYCRKLY